MSHEKDKTEYRFETLQVTVAGKRITIWVSPLDGSIRVFSDNVEWKPVTD